MDSEKDIKFIFNTQNLKQGDILLINSYHHTIQKRLSSKYDHVAMYMGDAFILEATGLCATINHIHSYGFRDREDAIVMRLKDWDQTMIDEVLFCARMKMGMEYGTLRAYYKIRDNGDKDTVNTNRTFCTRYVAQAYGMAGINIVKNPDYCIPDDFIHSEYLCKIEDILILAEDDEIDLVKKRQSQRENDEVLLARVFEKLRIVYDVDIQCFDQFLMAAIKHPEKDNDAIRVFEEFRYFDYDNQISKSQPWLLGSNTDFYNHYTTTEDRLFCLLNQKLHYDKTYLPIFYQNVLVFNACANIYSSSKLIKYLSDGFKHILDRAEEMRCKLDDLTLFVLERDKQSAKKFIKQYGIY